jgi:hypothetical protein
MKFYGYWKLRYMDANFRQIKKRQREYIQNREETLKTDEGCTKRVQESAACTDSTK